MTAKGHVVCIWVRAHGCVTGNDVSYQAEHIPDQSRTDKQGKMPEVQADSSQGNASHHDDCIRDARPFHCVCSVCTAVY